jgi:predicted ATPase/DNA-binding SARP family transcriptional activator
VEDGLVVGLLGPVEVASAGGGMAGAARPMLRVLVALLGVSAGRVVPDEALVDGLWGEEWSRERVQNLHTHVSALRRLLAAGERGRGEPRVVRSGGGYRLAVAETEVDAGLFRSLAGRGRAAARARDVAGAAELFTQALGLWRGAALADVVGLCPRLAGDAATLEELRAGVVEERVECDLALGRHAEVAAEVPGLVAASLLRERLAGQLMVALYRCGRRGEALAVFDSARRALAEQLGLDPGPQLAQVQASVLADDPSLAAHPRAAAGPPAAAHPPAAAGSSAAAPAGAGDKRAPPNNLPVQLARFIGRDQELSEVQALAGSSRLVTLTGAGGCGKTRLGLQVAAGLPDGPGDGAWLVELAAVSDENAVAPAICQALGIARQPGRAVLETLLDALAPQATLIVLDNCEHLIGGCAKTVDAIVRRCPEVRVLVTSREPLGIGGETIYRVPPMSLPGPGSSSALAESSDAVALFVDRARAQGIRLPADEESAALVVSICTRLDGLPLAVELAAARLRSMSLSDLHDRLGQRFRLLTGGSRTAMARQQTLRAAVEWSYSLLHGAERSLLRRLSVFAETFDLDAAEAVCGTGDIEAADVSGLLGSLVDKNLVVAEPIGPALRYRLLETIRQFAAERLAESGDEAAGAAHCAHFLHVAEAAASHLTGPEQGRWLTRLDADQVNLRRAAEHAAHDPDGTEQVLRFGVALRRYWMARNRDEDALALLIPVLNRPEAQADPELLGTALVTAALPARYVHIARTLELAEQAVKLARQLDTGQLLIESLAALCYARHLAGEPEQGLSPGREAVERARQLGDDVLLGMSLVAYLHCAAVIDPTYAQTLFTEAIACTQRSGDHLFAYYLNNIAGVHALRTGDIPAARACLHQAARAMRAIGDENPHLPVNMGWVLRQDNDAGGARSSFETALRISHRKGTRFSLAYATLGLACLAADAGDWHRAAVLHGTAQAFLDRTEQPWQDLEARYRHDSLSQVRAHLGQEQCKLACAEGAALSQLRSGTCNW